jgi:ubiquinone/menaquinone biosynthesis C-methylase UbiE
MPTGWFGRHVVTRALNRRNRELIEATLNSLELAPGMRLLDVGFGGGLSLRLARERGVTELWGVDPSADAVRTLMSTHRTWIAGGSLTLNEGSVEQLPLDDGSVDAIISTNTVYFWPDLASAFSSLHRVLAPSGRLAIGFSSKQRLQEMDAVTRHGFLFYEGAELLEQATRAGFQGSRLIELHGAAVRGTFVLVANK